MTVRVVFLDRASLKAKVRKLPSPPNTSSTRNRRGRNRAAAEGATVAIINKVPMRAETLRRLPQLKMIAVAATGYDVVDVAYCKEHGIAVANIRNYAVHTVPEHAFAMILALRRNLLSVPAGRREGRMEQIRAILLFHARNRRSARRHARHHRRGRDRSRHCGDRARLRHARAVCRSSAAEDAGRAASRRSTRCLAQSDVISLHCPLLPATRNLIDITRFAR